MISFYTRFLLCLPVLLGSIECSVAKAIDRNRPKIGAEFAEVLKYADAQMWEEAGKKVDILNNSSAFELLQWLKLRAGTDEFSEYESFLLVNGDWPGISLLRSQGERAINNTVGSKRVSRYFSIDAPLTANGALKYAEVLLNKQEINRAREVIRKSWLEHSYSKQQIKKAEKLFGSFLNQYHEERIDYLLWSGRLEQAEEMISIVPRDIQQLATVRIALQKQLSGVDSLIKNLPSHLKLNSGLLFDRFLYRKRKNLHEGAEKLLVDVSRNKKTLGRPQFWVGGRFSYARRALLSGNPKRAYQIASNHFIEFSDEVKKDAVELEWLAGFIAFEFLKEYKIALKHFQRYSRFVLNPINIAKANYWIGRSFEKLSDRDGMNEAYSVAAKYQTTFYGQLSAERGGVPIDLSIFRSDRYEWNRAEFLGQATVKSGILLFYAGRSVLADRFFNHASENLSRLNKMRLSQLANDLGLKSTGISIAQTAAQSGMYCPQFLFPDLKEGFLIDTDLKPLVLSIIRQESRFFSHSKSLAGALGMMQLMPRTASSMAQKLSLEFSEQKLLKNDDYNIKLGTHFLKILLKNFDGSTVLSLASYNAGPHRVKQWIKQFGDPRRKGTDPLVWIELIPFKETRNYVKRVIEASWVYEGKLNEIPSQLNLGRKVFGHKF